MLLPKEIGLPLGGSHTIPTGAEVIYANRRSRLEVFAQSQLYQLILPGFESLLLGGEQLAFALYAGLFVIFPLADFREDPGLLALLFEAA
jgi:hypothetical protein